MAEVRIEVRENFIYVTAPFKFIAVCKSVPGGRWNPNYKAWYYPATPRVAREIDKKFGATASKDDAFRQLVVAGLEDEVSIVQKYDDNPPDIPVVKTQPWLHQKQAFRFARDKKGAMLALFMGTGKTKVTIDLIQNRDIKRVLILCPKKVVEVWPEQLEIHCAVPYRVCMLKEGTVQQRAIQAKRFLDNEATPHHTKVVVINYDAARQPVFQQFALKEQWDLVVCDESHKIKSPSGLTSRFAANVGKRSKYRLALTGTPMNSPLDLYAQFRFLDTSVFGTSYTLFKARYCITGGYQGYEVLGYQNLEDLQARFNSLAFVCGKEVLDLPPFHHITRWVDLGTVARKHYNEIETHFLTELRSGNTVTADNALVELLRLQQITGGHLGGEVIDTSKAEELAEILGEIGPDEPLVVFARFRPDLDIIKGIALSAEDPPREYYELSGKADELAIWKQRGGVLGVQITAGGAGIDLTKARYAVYYSTGFSLLDYEQSLARIHRPGQTMPTTYIHLVARNTVDVKVTTALADKKNVVDSIIKEGNLR